LNLIGFNWSVGYVDNFQWQNWLIARLLTKCQQIKYAVFAAEQVIGIFESEYPNNELPRKAIKAAKEYLENPTAAAEAAAAEDGFSGFA